MKARILLVDDDGDQRLVYRDTIASLGYSVRCASSGREALEAVARSVPDLLISDMSMPEGDGLWLLERLRGRDDARHVPVILLSRVKRGQEDQIEALDLGADDYLPKPVSPGMLRAKIAAVLRRAGSAEELKEALKAHGLSLDPARRRAAAGGREMSLTRKEFDLLTAFLRRRGEVLSIPFLLEAVWSYDPSDYADPHTVQVHVWSLRKKLGERLGARIVTLPGAGYRFEG